MLIKSAEVYVTSYEKYKAKEPRIAEQGLQLHYQ